MSWKIDYDPGATNRIADDPRQFGKPLLGSKFGLWRYRLRDYRIVCEVQDKRLVVLAISIGHRSTIYED